MLSAPGNPVNHFGLGLQTFSHSPVIGSPRVGSGIGSANIMVNSN